MLRVISRIITVSLTGALSVLLRLWHKISPVFGNHCRYYPTCSEYALRALNKHGLLRGGWLSAKRVCRCNTLFPGGHDPIP